MSNPEVAAEIKHAPRGIRLRVRDLGSLHAFAQVALAGAFLVVLFRASTPWAVGLGLAAIAIGVRSSARPLAALVRVALTWLPLGIGLLAVTIAGAPIGAERVLWSGWHWTASRERFTAVVIISIRTAAIIAIGLRAAEWLTPSRIRRTVAELRLPPATARLGIGALAARTFVVDAAGEVARAQQLRAVDTRGSLLARVRAMPSFVTPLATNLMIEAAVRSAALERRGYERFVADMPVPRTLRLRDVVALAIAVSAVAMAMLW